MLFKVASIVRSIAAGMSTDNVKSYVASIAHRFNYHRESTACGELTKGTFVKTHLLNYHPIYIMKAVSKNKTNISVVITSNNIYTLTFDQLISSPHSSAQSHHSLLRSMVHQTRYLRHGRQRRIKRINLLVANISSCRGRRDSIKISMLPPLICWQRRGTS